MAERRALTALFLLIYFLSSSPSRNSTNSSGNFLLLHCISLRGNCRRSNCLKHEITKLTKHGSYVVSWPFNSYIVISTYFAICCDVHSNPGPENTSSDGRLIHYSREQLLSLRTSNHNNGSSNINDIAFHGLLHLHNSSLLTGYFSPVYGNVNYVGSDETLGLMDIFKKAYSNIQRFDYGSNSTSPSKSPIMNTNDAQDLDDGFIPVRITTRTDTTCWKPTIDYNLRILISIKTMPNPLKEFNSQSFLFTLFNARSLRNKAMAIKDYVVDNNIDILALTETWRCPGNGDDLEVGILCPNGYRFLHAPRTHGRGGGVGLLFKDTLRINSVLTDDFQSFEVMDILFRSLKCIGVLIIYRPPDSSYSSFFQDFNFKTIGASFSRHY